MLPSIFTPRHVFAWLLFAFSAGMVNATGVLACDNFVTNITGSVTSLGLNGATTRALLLVVSSFIAGAMIAFLMIETCRSRTPVAFVLPILLAFTILIAVAVTGKAGMFGVFGEAQLGRETFTLLSVLALAGGLVNAAVADATKNKVRVTHVTGPATDLAGNIVRAALDAGEGSKRELGWALLRIAKLGAFAFVAALTPRLTANHGFDTFAIAAAVLVIAVGFAAGPPRIDSPEPITPDEPTNPPVTSRETGRA